MPARTGSTTYIPGKGATTVKPSGKKTFAGKGPPPAGARKVKEPTYLTTPTITKENGTVTAEHFPSQVAARAAKERARTSERRTKAILHDIAKSQAKPPLKAKLPVRTEAASKVKLTPIQKVEQQSAKEFNAEGGKQVTVPFSRAATAASTPIRDAPRGPKPPPRAARRLKTEYRQAKKAVASSGGHLTGDLGPEQRRFVRGVAKLTHLKPRTIAAQARAEEGNAAQTEAEGTHNFLNMGPGISYPSLKAGVRATAANYNDTSSPNYAGVRATRGKSARQQAEAIAASPWGTKDLILQTLPTVGFKGKPNPQAERKLARVKTEAKEKGVGLSKAGPPPREVVTRYRAGLSAAKELAKGHIPYIWGGGHGSPHSEPTGGGLDCSGAVGYVLNKMGILKGSLTSGEMGSVLKPGPGAVTVFYNADHTFMSFGGKFFGTSVNDSSKGLAFYKNPGSGYLSEYSVGHVPGLGQKQALQLGIKSPTGSSSTQTFPGMTVSSNGTSATINSGAGTTQTKPGFSKKPISLATQVARTTNKLKALGIGSAKAAEPTTLSALERKYGTPAV